MELVFKVFAVLLIISPKNLARKTCPISYEKKSELINILTGDFSKLWFNKITENLSLEARNNINTLTSIPQHVPNESHISQLNRFGSDFKNFISEKCIKSKPIDKFMSKLKKKQRAVIDTMLENDEYMILQHPYTFRLVDMLNDLDSNSSSIVLMSKLFREAKRIVKQNLFKKLYLPMNVIDKNFSKVTKNLTCNSLTKFSELLHSTTQWIVNSAKIKRVENISLDSTMKTAISKLMSSDRNLRTHGLLGLTIDEISRIFRLMQAFQKYHFCEFEDFINSKNGVMEIRLGSIFTAVFEPESTFEIQKLQKFFGIITLDGYWLKKYIYIDQEKLDQCILEPQNYSMDNFRNQLVCLKVDICWGAHLKCIEKFLTKARYGFVQY